MSIKLLFFAMLFTFAAVPGFSQDWKSYHFYQPYPGYVIAQSNDTLRGYVVHGDRVSNQNKVVFYSDINDKKSKKEYKPADLKGYHVGDKEYRTIQWRIAKETTEFYPGKQ